MTTVLLGADTTRFLSGALHCSRILTVDITDTAPVEWVAGAATALLRYFRDRPGVASPDRTIVLLVVPAVSDSDDTAYRAAVVQSLRGIVQSVTREFAHIWGPVNLVAVDHDRIVDAAATIAFLDSDGGAYTAGSTIDLTVVRSAS